MNKATCSVGGCEKQVHAHKMCNQHYRRQRALTAPRCSMEECEGSAIARDLCPKHYARWSAHGDPSIIAPARPKSVEFCSIRDCERPASARTWCKRHYERWRLHGDPLATVRKLRLWAVIGNGPIEQRVCADCDTGLPIFEFPPHRSKPERIDTCRQCVRARRHERFGGVPSDQHHYKLLKKFGMTAAEYNAMVEAHGGRCAICRRLPYGGRKDARKKYLSVDHCHTTGKVRGLLCDSCNLAIGLFKDDPDRMLTAVEYLKRAAS